MLEPRLKFETLLKLFKLGLWDRILLHGEVAELPIAGSNPESPIQILVII